MKPLVLSPKSIEWETMMKQNDIVRVWSLDVRNKLRSSATRFKKGKKQAMIERPKAGGPLEKVSRGRVKRWKEFKLAQRLTHNVYKKFGLSEGIGFRIQQQGVWVHKGVGRGYQIRGGMVVRVSGKGIGIKKQSRLPINEPIRRHPVDWFNPVVDANTNFLADQIAQVNEDAAVNAMRMRIN